MDSCRTEGTDFRACVCLSGSFLSAAKWLNSKCGLAVSEGVGSRIRVGDPCHPVFIIIRQRRNRSSRDHRLAVPVRVVSVALGTRARQVIVAVVAVSIGDAVEDFGLPVLVVIVGIPDGVVSGRSTSRFGGELVGRLVPEGRDCSVGVGAGRDVVDPVISISVVREGRVGAGLVQDVGRAIRVVVGICDRAAVRVDLPCLPVGVVVAEGSNCVKLQGRFISDK